VSEQPALPPIKVACVISGEVVDVLHMDARFAAMFLTPDALFIDVTGADGLPTAAPGDLYDPATGFSNGGVNV